jgi:hypothetical protein
MTGEQGYKEQKMKKEKSIIGEKVGRRKFIAVSALAAMATSFLRKFAKDPKIALKDLRVSLHPAQFYKKLYSDK